MINPTSLTYSASDLTKLFKVSYQTIMMWRKKGILPAPKKFGRTYRWIKSEIDSFLNEPTNDASLSNYALESNNRLIIKQEIKAINLFIDAGSRPNPGLACIALVICDQDLNILCDDAKFVGEMTNHQAQYHALIDGLNACVRFNPDAIDCFSDSHMLIGQMNNDIKVNNGELRKLSHQAVKLAQRFKDVTYKHADRSHPMMQRAHELLSAISSKMHVNGDLEAMSEYSCIAF